MPSPDPRPGRWILPLVVLGMVLFTYVFVQTVPGGGNGDTPATDDSPSTTAPGAEATTTTTTIPVDPETAAFLASVDELVVQLETLSGEMAAVNAAWDADPRQIEYEAAEAQISDVADRTAAWAQSVAALAPPAALAAPHQTLVTTAQAAADAAAGVLAGLQGPESQPRLDALARLTQSASTVRAAADQIREAAAAAATAGAAPTTTAAP